MFLKFWEVYPRKVGKQKAEEAFAKARQRLVQEKRFLKLDPGDFLISKAEEFAATPVGQAGQFCPHPTTWLNQACYDDDPAEWHRTRDDEQQDSEPTPLFRS